MIRIGFEILPTHRHGISDSQNKVDSNRYDRPDFIDAYEKRPDQPDGEEEALTSDTGNQEQGSPAETGSIGIDSLLTDEHFYQIQVHNEISCLRECEAEGSDSGESYDSDTQAEAATSAHTESFAKLVDYDEIFASRIGEEVNGPVKQNQSAHPDRMNSTNLTATLSRVLAKATSYPMHLKDIPMTAQRPHALHTWIIRKIMTELHPLPP
ncbi:hypothetical protein ACFSS8_04635 [Paracoccus kondratievae]